MDETLVSPAVSTWRVAPEQLARCLVATIPSYMDEGYGEIAARFLDGRAPPVDQSRPAGTWMKVGLGYAFIGPAGGQHFYTRTRPDVPDTDIVAPASEPPGRLFAAAKQAHAQASAFADGAPISGTKGGQPIQFTCPAGERGIPAEIATTLAGALAAAQPGYNSMILGQHAGLMLSGLAEGRTAGTVIQASHAAVDDLRTRYAADGWLYAITFTRAMLASFIQADQPGQTKLLLKSMDGLSCGNDPERMLHQVVLDYAQAGHANLVLRVIDTVKDHARTCKDAALAATTVEGHLGRLYQAAQYGFTGWVLTDLLRQAIPEQLWPPSMTRGKLSGYNSTAEEVVVRASVALEVGCINTATRAALDVHLAEVREKGAAWADELITEYWYYPTGMRDILLAGKTC